MRHCYDNVRSSAWVTDGVQSPHTGLTCFAFSEFGVMVWYDIHGWKVMVQLALFQWLNESLWKHACQPRTRGFSADLLFSSHRALQNSRRIDIKRTAPFQLLAWISRYIERDSESWTKLILLRLFVTYHAHTVFFLSYMSSSWLQNHGITSIYTKFLHHELDVYSWCQSRTAYYNCPSPYLFRWGCVFIWLGTYLLYCSPPLCCFQFVVP